MQDEQPGHTPGPALAELRSRLAGGLARAGLDKTQLARRAGLGRTTVQEAFRADAPAPSEQTLAALARALRLPVEELLDLRRRAVEPGQSAGSGPGNPIGQWDPYALEIHPAGEVPVGSDPLVRRVLPGYVEREHDRILEQAVREAGQGRSRMLVLVGTSSTGKTRACWEAVQPLAGQGWRLWHPFDPTRAAAALEELHRVGPRTVVWLNEAQHYLGDKHQGEEIAAAIHTLLTQRERGPVLVLGTLWPEYAQQYTALPRPSVMENDPHSRARELLAGRTVRVPDTFDTRDLATAAALAQKGDQLLTEALARAHADGRLTQDLAGAPALLERYRTGSPAARALLEAAMDSRRLGVSFHLPQVFLIDAATDYLHDTDWDQLTDDWAEKAYADLAEPVHGKQAALRRATPRPTGPFDPADAPSPQPAGTEFRLADYLEQHGRITRRHLCPPASFWHAAHTHLTHPDDLHSLAQAAEDRHRLQWAHHLRHRAANHGNPDALARQAGEHGSPAALAQLPMMRERTWDPEDAENLVRQAAKRAGPSALARLARIREVIGDREGAEILYQQDVDHGDTLALARRARAREEAGDREGAEALACQAADQGDVLALALLAGMREEAGDREGAEVLARQAADHGSTGALVHLIWMREEAWDLEGAETLLRQAADYGNILALAHLAGMREEAGDWEGAGTLYRQVADHGAPHVLARSDGTTALTRRWPYGLDPDGTPTPRWR